MAGKKYFIVGDRNYIGSGSDKITVINSDWNYFNPNVSGVVLINCSGVVVNPGVSALVLINTSGGTYDTRYNNLVLVDGIIQVNKKSRTLTAGSYTMSTQYGMNYCNDTGGDINITLGDASLYKDCEVTYKRVTSGGNLITFNGYIGTELFEFASLPQSDVLVNLGDSVTITTNGTDWYIK